MKKILLLDIENVHKTENELVQLLTSYTYVYLVYAKSPLSLSLDGLQNLAIFISTKKLVLIKMPKVGPDAADFGLAFVAGQLSIQMEKQNTEFDVISNDKKFEYIIDLLRIMGFKAQQIKRDLNKSDKLDIANFDGQKVEYKHLLIAIELLVKNQPKQFNSLNNALKSWMRSSGVDIKQIVELLKKYQFISIKNQSVSYELSKMKEIIKVQENRVVEKLVVELPKIEEIQQKPHLQKIKQYCDYLMKIQKGRPVKIESLLNSIQAVLRLDREQYLQDFFNILKKQNIVFQANNNVTYNDQLIEAWASIAGSCLLEPNIKLSTIHQQDSEIAS